MRYQKRNAEEVDSLCQVSAGIDARELQQEIIAGQAEFFTLDNTAYIVRGEKTSRGREFVVCCAEGRGLRQTIKALIKHARAQHFNLARFHPKTDNAGRAFLKMAGLRGYKVTEQDNSYYLAEL